MPLSPDLFAALPITERAAIYNKFRCVQRIIERQRGSALEAAHREARSLNVSASTVLRWVSNYKKHGGTGLIDSRRVPQSIRSSARFQS